MKNYEQERDFPAIKGTSGLSAHHKFGTLSVREVFQRVKENLGLSHSLIRELFWRDFFTHIGFYFPRVFSGCFYQEYDAIQWENNQKKFKAWCQAETGFPLVDAGMRELLSTGFMHNRVRMVVASFLTKDLHIDWRWGEKYFAQHLVDYDPAVNNGNWQWAASTGCDAQPYFRIFNPWRQQERFDSDCKYIKKWLPELKNIPAKKIHRRTEVSESLCGYPAPIVGAPPGCKNSRRNVRQSQRKEKQEMSKPIALVYPHQIFRNHPALEKCQKFLLIEDPLFFKQYSFHKQKITLHHATFLMFADYLKKKKISAELLLSKDLKNSDDIFSRIPKGTAIFCAELDDDWLQRRLKRAAQKNESSLTFLQSPGFLSKLEDSKEYFKNKKYFMAAFYQHQRKSLNILVEKGAPVGGKWSFDPENRKKITKKNQNTCPSKNQAKFLSQKSKRICLAVFLR